MDLQAYRRGCELLRIGLREFRDIAGSDHRRASIRRKVSATYFKNFTVWYDDGKFNARVAYQGQSEYFDFISSCSNAINNYPTSFAQCPGQTIRTPYNPGGTNYREATEFFDLNLSYQFNEH